MYAAIKMVNSVPYKSLKICFVATVIMALIVTAFPLPPVHAETVVAAANTSSGAPEGPNVLVNGGFEQASNELPASWNKWVASGSPQFASDGQTVKQGSRSLKIQAAETSRGSMTQSVRVEQNQNYQLSAWIKTDNIVSNDRGVVLRYQFSDADGKKIGTDMFTAARKGTSDWQQLTHKMAVPSGAVKVLVELFLWGATGTVWFDDVRLSKTIAITDLITPSHPRLLATASDFEALKGRIASDARLKNWYDILLAKANKMLTEPPSKYELPDGVRLLSVSRKVIERIHNLALIYRLTGDAKYAERAWTELEAAGNFKDWNPSHFLDTAEMTHAFAIGYDWLYDYWTTERKTFLRNATVTKGFGPALTGYNKPDFWVTTTNNWNFVVNGGIGMGALAFGDEPEVKATAEDLLQRGFASLPNALPQWAPDGGWYEGPGYWSYSIQYIGLYFKALKTALGTDFGLSQSPGLPLNGDFPIYTSGPANQTFNFADAGSGIPNAPSLYWFGTDFDKPEYGWWQTQRIDKNPSPLDLLWYVPNSYPGPRAAGVGLDKYFRNVEAATFRSAWEDPNALFAGFKGTSKEKNHNNLDAGTFVFDALGVRWAQELGSDDYNLPGYFGNQRWTYYRMRSEGQNTLVINPGEGPDQNPNATINLKRVESTPREALAVADLTSAYADQAIKAERGIRMLDYRRQFLVQDEVQAKAPSEFWWFMHTSTQIDQIDPNGQWAMLKSGGKRLWARILSPAQAKFVAMDAQPLPTSPNPGGQNPNNGIRKLAVHIENVQDLRLSVLMVPLREGEAPPSVLPPVVPLSDWHNDGTAPPLLSGITVNGAPLAGFSAETFTYDASLPAGTSTVPVVTAAAASSGAEVTVQQAAKLPGTAWIDVKLPGGAASRYAVHFPGKVGAGEAGLPILDVTASADDGNVAENTIDDDLATRWSAEGDGQWITYDLGAPTAVRSVSVAWYKGNERTSAFDIEISTDGANWTQVYSGTSSGISAELENYATLDRTARYVRIVGRGNSQNKFNSIVETRIYDRIAPEQNKTPALKSVALATDVTDLKVTQTAKLSLSGTMTTGAPADLQGANIQYQSSNPAIVDVGSDGVVTAKAEGTARVTAAVTLGGYLKFGSAQFTVIDPLNRKLYPTHDTFVRDGTYADTNYGTSGTLTVKKSSPGFERQTFLQFDLSGVAGEVESAVLSLYGNVADSGGTEADQTVHTVENDGWTEKTVTWNNRPAVGDALATAKANSTPAWRDFDITGYIRAQLAGDKTASLAVVQDSAPGLATNFNSKENAQFKPNLTIKIKDLKAPKITVTGVTYGQGYADSVSPAITAEDAESGVKTLSVTLNGEPYVSETPITAAGVHTLRAEASDFAGNTATETVTFAVYYANRGPVTAAGWFAVDRLGTVAGSVYSINGGGSENNNGSDKGIAKLHLEANLGYASGLGPTGSVRLHIEPAGLRLDLQKIGFLVITDQSAIVQGTASGSDGGKYTLRMALNDPEAKGKATPSVSLIVWKEGSESPVLEYSEQPLTGAVKFHK
ncbi:DNRLRE domain-containing protein [Paenibacillus allorhizosphaerae]|uniref:F5/8 type C domain-containing protein n=1 Tax=Paenibacillus allorhizosphaerae TaxID=2849866 RepID=A0ABN7TS50_9BACL|nr:DNRLRE domain-containing protein [Paenibacillus allorhizosphaerae]CAG7653539.1 hypothetical protein PAECIP111802_05513 [Paenibacillus allorhizosphaerae]